MESALIRVEADASYQCPLAGGRDARRVFDWIGWICRGAGALRAQRIVFELGSSQANFEAYLQELEGVLGEGLAAIDKVRVRFYRGGPQASD
jgi:hypothetical protein